jgi:hypothetical protein
MNRPRTVHIVGGPGSGKTTLADRIGETLGLPVHHLDEVARVGGGTGPVRSEQARSASISAILAQPGWVTEGVHLGWTDALFEWADLVVWLDVVDWSTAARRMTRRFAAGARNGNGNGTGNGHARSLFGRVRDGAGHARDLAAAVAEARNYYAADRGTPNLPETRSATRWRVEWCGDRAVHCAEPSDVERLLRGLEGAGG